MYLDRERNALYINGLYRHGFLLTPTIVEEVLVLLSLQEHSNARPPCLRVDYFKPPKNHQDSYELPACSSS